jgi:hypothetical protein
MTKVRIEEYYQKWSGQLTLFGGIPANMLLADLATDEEFEAYIQALYRAVAPGDRFILGFGDNVPPEALFHRVRRIAEFNEKYGTYPIAA